MNSNQQVSQAQDTSSKGQHSQRRVSMHSPALQPSMLGAHRSAAAAAALLATLCVSSARAGFLDERNKAAATPVASKPAPSVVAPVVPAATGAVVQTSQAPASAQQPASAPPSAPAGEVRATAAPAATAPVVSTPTPSPVAAAMTAAPVAAPVSPPQEAGVRRGTLAGVFNEPGWSDKAPRSVGVVGVPSAVSKLLPPKHSAVSIESDDDVVDTQVSWPETNMSRREALEYVAATYGLNMAIGDGVLRITRAELTKGVTMYSVSPADVNFRRLLKRWSPQAGYTFEDQHWTLSRDLPIVASGALGTDFKAAVRVALDATEFTAMPARACFYSNNVLRVVPRNEQCNRTPRADPQ